MESENKIISDVSEKTNSLSVVPDETMKSAEISAAKESEEKDVDKDRKKSRKESKDRSDRRSRDRRTSKAREEDRRRSSDRSRRHDREKEGDRERRDKEKEGDRERRDKEKEGERQRRDKDKEGDKENDKVREKDREKDSTRERDRDRDSRRDRDRDRERGRSTRDRGRDSRDRERSRRSTSRTRRDRDSRRRRSRSASPDDRHRNKSRRRSASPDKKGKDESGDSSKPKPITLRDIIALNPGISVAEAAIRLNAYNTAVARGLTPESVTAPLQSAPGIPMGIAGSAAAAGGINPVMAAMMGEGGAATKPHRELYVGNLPPGITVPQIAEFMNAAFKQMGLAKDSTQNTVITAWVSPDGKFAFVELRSIEDATAALTHLNGIQVGAYSLRIGRPKGYNAAALPGASAVAVPMQSSLPSFSNPLLTSSVMGAAPGLGNSNPLLSGLNSSLGLGMPAEAMSNAIMVTNLPALISEAQIRELFTPFGELRAFNVIKTPSGSTQSAVLEYVNPALTEGVIGGMNGLDIADHKLSVLRIPASSAAVLLQPTSAPPPPAGPPPLSVGSTPAPAAVDELSACDPTTVIRLSNMTTPQDLSDDQSYEELMEDVADECNSHGTVKSIVIPRTGSDSSVGKIFVHFVDIAGAQATLKAVAGRKFNGRVVEAYFYPEALFLQKTYCLPAGYLAGENNSKVTSSNDKPEPSLSGSNNNSTSSAAADINDIDEGEHDHTYSNTTTTAAGVYDPSAVMEDLD